jgi:glutamate carboxypeptidase
VSAQTIKTVKTVKTVKPTPAERKILDAMDDAEAAMIARVKDWAKVNSGSANLDGLERMRALIAGAFAELEGEIEPVALPPSEIVEPDGAILRIEHPPALRVKKRPDAPTQVALTGHSDTVFPAESSFKTARQSERDRLTGPGVADMKGGILVMREALLALERSSHAKKLGWEVLISPDEEIGSPGSRVPLAALGARAHVAMTYEPALPDGALAGARKGSGNFAVIVRGRAAHAGREHHLGRNAVAAAARFAAALDGLNGARDGVTFNIAKIDGGGAVNVVPDLAVVRFNVRMPKPADQAWAEAEIARLVMHLGAGEGIRTELKGGITRGPKPMAAPNAALFGFTRDAGSALGLAIEWRDTGGVCEGNNLWAAGCPNVDTLGVRGGGIHSTAEYAVISSFVERARLSALMLMKMASGAFDVRGLRERS